MRARMIKPGFFKNEELAEVGMAGMLLFQGLWMLADRAGRLEDRPKRIKVEALPYFDCDVDSLLDKLARRDFIVRYKVRGSAFIAIPSWEKHQKPHIREAESLIPPPSEADEEPRETEEAFPNSGDAQPRSCLSTTLVSETRHARVKDKDSSLDLDHRDQEPRQDQEPKIADQVPALIVNQAITRPAPRQRGAARLPDPWPLTPERGKYAAEQGVDPLRTHQDFCDYWHARADAGARKLDWDATWRTWCRRAADRGHGLARASPDMLLPAVPMSKAEAALAAAYREAAMEEAEKVVEVGSDQN